MIKAAKDGSLLETIANDEEILCGGPCEAALIIAAGGAISALIKNPPCFSGSSTVQTTNGIIAIKDLTLDDSVLTFTPGFGAHYTKVRNSDCMSDVGVL